MQHDPLRSPSSGHCRLDISFHRRQELVRQACIRLKTGPKFQPGRPQMSAISHETLPSRTINPPRSCNFLSVTLALP